MPIGAICLSAWPDSRSPSQPSASTSASGRSPALSPSPASSASPAVITPAPPRSRNCKRRLEMPLVQLDPLAAEPDQRHFEPRQLSELGRIQRLVPDGELVPEVDEVGQAELRRGRPSPGAAAVLDLVVSFSPSRDRRTQSGSMTPKPAPASSGPVSFRKCRAPRVSSATDAGAAVCNAASSSGNSLDARPRPASRSSSG